MRPWREMQFLPPCSSLRQIPLAGRKLHQNLSDFCVSCPVRCWPPFVLNFRFKYSSSETPGIQSYHLTPDQQKEPKKKERKRGRLIPFLFSDATNNTQYPGKKCSHETSLGIHQLGLDLPMQEVGGSISRWGVNIPPASWSKKSRHKTEATLKQIQ